MGIVQRLDTRTYQKMIDLVIDYRTNEAVKKYFNRKHIQEFQEIKDKIDNQDTTNIKKMYVNHVALLVNVDNEHVSVLTKEQVDTLFDQLAVQIHTI